MPHRCRLSLRPPHTHTPGIFKSFAAARVTTSVPVATIPSPRPHISHGHCRNCRTTPQPPPSTWLPSRQQGTEVASTLSQVAPAVLTSTIQSSTCLPTLPHTQSLAAVILWGTCLHATRMYTWRAHGSSIVLGLSGLFHCPLALRPLRSIVLFTALSSSQHCPQGSQASSGTPSLAQPQQYHYNTVLTCPPSAASPC